MATGSDILSYTGSGGLGSNADIPAISDKNLDAINQTADRLLLLNAAQNQELFRQKVRDRDKLIEAIDSGSISVGDLLERDMPLVKEGLQRLDEAYFKRIKKGINDLDAASEYKKALREAQDRVTQAQARKVFNDTENIALSKETLPRKQSARKANLDKSLGSFWSDMTPYQQALDYDFDKIKTYPVATTTELPADKNRPYEKGKRTSYDLGQITREATKDFLEDNVERENQMGLFNSFQSMPAQQAWGEMQPMIKRLEEYNKIRGLKPGDPGHAATDIIATDPNGQPVVTPQGTLLINKKVPEFAALWSLASVPKFAEDVWEVDKGKIDIGKLKLDQVEAANLNRYRMGQLAIDRDRLNFDKAKAKAAGVPGDVANSAKAYAVGLFTKLTSLADANGVISSENLKKLTADELKYLGAANVEENNFSLTPLGISDDSKVRITPDGTLEIIETGGFANRSVNRTTVDLKQVAGNKLGEEMTLTTGKEGINYNNLVDLYDLKPVSGKEPNAAQPTKKEIKRSDISAKAAAAGYSPKEYEALLKKNGVTIKD